MSTVQRFAIAVLLIAAPFFASAAELYITPSNGAYSAGDLFSVVVTVDTAGAYINAASSQINFDNQRLEAQGLGYSRSIFTLWTQEPSYSNAGGTVTFSGGVPSPGYNGPAGSVVRITFKALSAGAAKINFASGAVLANDGLGTNIASKLTGAEFGILAAAAPSAESKKIEPEPPSAGEEIIAGQRPLEAPTITNFPGSIEAGQTITIQGLGLPLSRVSISVQKGDDDPARDETFTGTDGRFSYTYSKSVESGVYRIWARSISPEGVISPQSRVISIESVQPLFFRIGTSAVNYASIIVTLLALLAFAILLIFYIWMRVRQWRVVQGKEISEAEKALHSGFDTLKDGFRKYFKYLGEARSAQNIKRREDDIEERLEKDLGDVERGIGREISDIRRTKPRKDNEE